MKNYKILFHFLVSICLMFIVFIVFFSTYYGGDRDTASSAMFIMFAILLIITFTSYKSKYKLMPSRRYMKRFKNDYEAFKESQVGKGKEVFIIIMNYLPVTLVTLTFSLLLTYA